MAVFGKQTGREILSPFKKTRGGVNVLHSKNTQDCKSVTMPPPKSVTILMSQHIGAFGEVICQKGDKVKVGQVIGESEKAVFAPLHSSVSGEVKDIVSVMLPNGTKTKGIVIESDGKMEECDFTPSKVENEKDLIKAVRESGLVGLGGSGFPTHIKLSVKEKNIDTIIINGAECEPYITADYRECIENSRDIMSGVHTLLKILKPNKIIIAIEDNKPKAIEVLAKLSESEGDKSSRVEVMSIPSKYPQGAEKVLIHAVTGRKVSAGKLPSDVGVIVMNITSVAFLGRYLKTGKPLVSKRLTVDGSAVAKPQNVIVPIGTSVKEVIQFCGGYQSEPQKILAGGPMMGLALVTDEYPILKQNNTILAFDEKDIIKDKERVCIRCGKCLFACPMNLMPTKLEEFLRKKDIDALIKNGIHVCIECGSCSFVCPAKRNLVQSMKNAKKKSAEGGRK